MNASGSAYTWEWIGYAWRVLRQASDKVSISPSGAGKGRNNRTLATKFLKGVAEEGLVTALTFIDIEMKAT